MISKQKTLTLSFLSVVSSFLIKGLAVFLLLSDDIIGFSFISHPCASIKVISLLAALLFTITYMVMEELWHENSLFKEKVKTQIITALKSAALLLILSFMYHFMAVLFGAPVLMLVSETYHFAILLTVLTGLPMCAVAGPRLDKWMDILTTDREPGLQTVVYLTTVGALLGAWVGAIPIPLDWDRPWQNWPISCSIGCVSGYSVGLFIASVYLPHQFKALFKQKYV